MLYHVINVSTYLLCININVDLLGKKFEVLYYYLLLCSVDHSLGGLDKFTVILISCEAYIVVNKYIFGHNILFQT